MRSKLAFCTKCNCERPTFKDYLYDKHGKRISKWRLTICVVCRERVYVPSKFHNKPTKSQFSERIFHSKKEARREPALVAMQNAGNICELRYQVPYRLEVYGSEAVDALLDAVESDEPILRAAYAGLRALANHVRRSRQTIAKYVCDFQYRDRHGNLTVEDVKGRVTPEYRIKKRLMLACFGIEVVEPGGRGVDQRARGAGISGSGTGSHFSGGDQ